MTRRTQMTNASIERCVPVPLSCPWVMRFSTTRISPHPPYPLLPSSTDKSIPSLIYKTKATTGAARARVCVCPTMTEFGNNIYINNNTCRPKIM